MNRFFSIILGTNLKHRKMITALAIVIAMILGVALTDHTHTRTVAPASVTQTQSHKAELMATSTRPHGWKFACRAKMFYLTPYLHCRILLQPGNTQEYWWKIRDNPQAYGAIVIGLFGALCAAAGPYVAFICAAMGGIFADSVWKGLYNGSLHQKCFESTWDIFPSTNPMATNVRIREFGAGYHWVYILHHFAYGDDYIREWLHNDDCQYYGSPPGSPVII